MIDAKFTDPSKNKYLNPVDYFNIFGDFKSIFEGVKKCYLLTDTTVNNDPIEPRKATFTLNGTMVDVQGDNSFDIANGTQLTKFMCLTAVKFKGDYSSAQSFVSFYLMKNEIPYIRVGTDYFKVIKKQDRYGADNTILKAWDKTEITLDHTKELLKKINKFDDFTIRPNNKEFRPVIGQCYNLYSKFPHQPFESDVTFDHIPTTTMLLRHIFGDQFELGLRYMKILYEYPEQILPVIALVSAERETGKTTFLNWLSMIFGENSTLINPHELTSDFNAGYATKNIIMIDETVIEKSNVVEKLKALATAKSISVSQKFVSQYSIPFFGKIIISTNKETDFMRVDREEIRFWVRKVNSIPKENKNTKIEHNLFTEIPKFIKLLSDIPEIDFTKSRMVFTKEEISTGQLENVKQESKSWLHKELDILIEDYFNNKVIQQFHATPLDIKKLWFNHNSKVDINYIRRVLKIEMRVSYVEKVINYPPIWINDGSITTTTGKPFIFDRDDFVQKEELNTLVNNIDEDLPF